MNKTKLSSMDQMLHYLKRHWFPCILLSAMISCVSVNQISGNKGPSDKHYEFLNDIKRITDFDYFNTIIDFRQFGSYSKNLWLRQPENLRGFYASIKKLGIQNFLSEEEFNTPLFNDHWAQTCWKGKSINQIFRNLISSYHDTEGVDKYYKEFWERRRTELNDSIVQLILIDICKTYDNQFTQWNWDDNDSITGLLGFEMELQNESGTSLKQSYINYFHYLNELNLYSSANNLIHYANELHFDSVSQNDSTYMRLIALIESDSVNFEQYWYWRESAEWFRVTYHYGP